MKLNKIRRGANSLSCFISLSLDKSCKRTIQGADVSYIYVAGELDLSGPIATKTSLRLSRSSFRALNGNGDVTGEGLVPRDQHYYLAQNR